MCVDRTSGKIVHDVEVFHKDEPGPIHRKNSHASPTPVLDGDRVYVHFGAHGTACLDTDGHIIWRNNELKYDHRHGPAGSPVIYRDLLIVSCDGTDVQFVVALDKRTGKIRWKKTREGKMAYSTPLVVNVDGHDELISTGADQAIAYDPLTGKEIWSVRYDGYSEVPRPVVSHGLVFLCTGYDTPGLYAVRLGGQGDVTDTHVVWTMKKGAPLQSLAHRRSTICYSWSATRAWPVASKPRPAKRSGRSGWGAIFRPRPCLPTGGFISSTKRA